MEGYQSEGIELEFSEAGSFIEGYLLEYHDSAVWYRLEGFVLVAYHVGQAFEIIGLAEFDFNSDFLSFVIGFLEIDYG